MAYLRILVGLAISVACIAALLTQIDVHQTIEALSHARPGWLILADAMLLVVMGVKAYRWGLLYYPTRGLHLRNLTSALFIGYMISSVIDRSMNRSPAMPS